MRIKLLILLAAVFLIGGFWVRPAKETSVETIRISGESLEILAEIADTPEARTLGLSGREDLAKNRGLLFVFDRLGMHSFWMKDMRFPIDIIWLRASGGAIGVRSGEIQEAEIVHIERNVSPDTYPASFVSAVPADLVLETVAGFSETHNLEIGQKVFFRK